VVVEAAVVLVAVEGVSLPQTVACEVILILVMPEVVVVVVVVVLLV